MASINRVLMVGRLVRDPELKDVREGLTAARITIATDFKSRKPGNEENKEVCFIDATAWNREAEQLAKQAHKGDVIAVEGRLKLETWTDNATGAKRSKHMIVIDTILYFQKMENDPVPLPQEQKQYVEQPRQVQRPLTPPPAKVFAPSPDFDDDLPF